MLSGELSRNPVNIPSVPREVMPKIEPCIDLSAKLGTFLAHSDMNGIESLTINYAGDLAALRIAPLTQNIVKGFLQRRLGSQVNNVNASYIAERSEEHTSELQSRGHLVCRL